ncbi:MAG: hypothetical protein Q7R49_04145 [Candidatus Daviesbacteria bacterium]|nr:hypothetical protein [Candidatus Daviesbacteria bacterium]
MTITKKMELEESKPFPRKIIFLGGFVLSVLVILQIWANNTLVTYGTEFEKIRQMQQSLQLENQILENNIAKMSSIDNIATASSILGLEPSKDVQYLH